MKTQIWTFLFFQLLQVSYGNFPNPRLRKRVLENYDKVVIPHKGEDFGTDVTVGMQVIHVDIDEEKQNLQVDAWVALKWKDERLEWKSGDENKGFLHFTPDEVWVPDLALYNNGRGQKGVKLLGDVEILVQHNGSVLWVPSLNINAGCKLDLRRWPKDTQNCSVVIGPWTHHEKENNLIPGIYEDSIALDHLVEYGEWKLKNVTVKRHSKTYNCCEENYVDLTYEFILQRTSTIHCCTFVIPLFGIAIINLLTFLHESQKNERLQMASTTFFITSMFLLYFDFTLPPVDHSPHIVVLYSWNLILSLVSIGVTIIVSCLQTSNCDNPRWTRMFNNRLLSTILCLGHGKQKQYGLATEKCHANCAGEFENQLNIVGSTIDRLAFILLTIFTSVLYVHYY